MFWRRKRSAADFTEEIRAHLQLEADDQSSRDPGAAARRAFGNVTAAEERFYERGRLLWIDHALQDLRYSLRMMRQTPGFTLAMVLTLALAIGANTAIFSLIDAVLLRFLPVKDPASLYFVQTAGARGPGPSPPYPCFERFRSQTTTFAGISAYAGGDFGIRITSSIEQVDGARVSGNYFELLGVAPVAGRLLTPADEALDPPAAVISYSFWQKRFGGNRDALGKTFALDDRRYTIVGVTPREFHGLSAGRSDDVTLPITLAGPKVLHDPTSWWFGSIARVKPGVPRDRALAELEPIYQAFLTEYPVSAAARRDFFKHMELSPASRGMDQLRKRFSRPLWALMAVVGLVLLIACANITNLLLARAARREREFAVRVAIGAGRARLFRQLMVETGLLFAAGALAGLVFAWWAAHAVVAFFAGGSQPIVIDVQWDWRVAGFTAALSLLATLIFGAAPVLRALRANPHAAMKDGGRTTASRGGIELGQFLVAFQVALSLILLVGAALFLRTLMNLYRVDAGFHAEQTALIQVHLPDPTYRDAASRGPLWDRILADARSLAGVRSAGLTGSFPLDGRYRSVRFDAPGYQPRATEESAIGMNTVSDGYFPTLGTALLQGRDFTASDRPGAPQVALLNETASRHFFNGRNPVGTVVKLNGGAWQIIGVVQDIRDAGLRQEAGRYIYVPARQFLPPASWMTLILRTGSEPESMLATVQRRISGLAPDIQIVRTGTLARQVDDSLLQERLISTLAAAFGLLALLLSAVGLYGVLAYSVARRTSEIGIRMALGALPGQVVRSVLQQTLWVVAAGLAVGIPSSIMLAGAAESLLYGVTPTDGIVLAGPAAVLAAVALLASYLPARRAGRIDPLRALRYE